MRLALAALLCGICLATPSRAQEPFPIIVMPGQDVRSNSRGLECRQTPGHVPAYAAPSPGAPVVRYMPTVVAVTGPARNGFVPVYTRDGSPGWVRASYTYPNSRHKTCFVQRTRDGTLRWSTFNSIQSD